MKMGKVYCFNLNFQWVALKKVKISESDSNEGLPHTFLREISVMMSLKDVKNIVQVLDVYWNEKYFIIALEYAERGDLWCLLQKSPATHRLTFEQVRGILKQILIGVELMHRKGIIHRDLKTSNILLAADSRVLLADFGLSRFMRIPG